MVSKPQLGNKKMSFTLDIDEIRIDDGVVFVSGYVHITKRYMMEGGSESFSFHIKDIPYEAE